MSRSVLLLLTLLVVLSALSSSGIAEQSQNAPALPGFVLAPHMSERGIRAAPVSGLTWLQLVNQHRAMTGLPSVSERGEWSAGDVLHGRYCVKNGVLTHPEDPANPWYTPEGHIAGTSSNLAGHPDSNAPDEFAIDAWMQAPFHALGILDPRLLEVGYGTYREATSTSIRMVAGLDVIRGLGASPRAPYPIVWPGNNTTIVPPNPDICPAGTACHWGESPSPLTGCPGYTLPSGLPLILQLGGGSVTPSVTSSSLLRDGAPLEHCVIDETRYTNPDPGQQSTVRSILGYRDAVVILPRAPLPVGSQYQVSVQSGGLTYAWSFTIGSSTCNYSLGPSSGSIGQAGGSVFVQLTTAQACAWNSGSQVDWITTSSAPRSGSGLVVLTVAPVAAGTMRSGTVLIAGQTFTVTQGPTIALDQTSLQFGATTQSTSLVAWTSAQTIRMSQNGTGTITWTATTSHPWLQVSPSSGVGPAQLSISVTPVTGLPPSGTVAGAINLSLSGAAGSAGPVSVDLRLKPRGTSANPFGSTDTPTDNRGGVTGAVPFTGWALDDIEVARVTVCRAAFGTEVAPADPNCGGAAQVYVGDAVFIDGARPDVTSMFPLYPANTRAGWGLMVLTNMLPNQGNGTYVFHMYAHDRDGRITSLGTRTMTCANANATKPFGAIDTPAQGGVASGASFVNFGWALTPQPKVIPLNGSTITVLVDGTSIGTVDYNHERPDIETLFPGFQNTVGSNGAIGFRVIDTTTLTNGLHTISWTVVDNQGAIEGIGSRFFTVSNGAGALTAAPLTTTRAPDIATAARAETPVLGRRGWDLEAPWRWYGVGSSGRAVIRGEEIDRFEVWLGAQPDAHYTGHLRVGDELAALPVGSQLDAATGWFTWAPGVGFVGAYDLVFVRWAGAQALARHEVRVTLAPKGRGHVGVQVAIDTPRSQQDVGQPFVLAGWAADLDAATGTGIDTLHVWAYPLAGGAPVFLGTPTLGGARPDVAAIHGDQFRAAGFGLPVQGLTPGIYDLAVFPWSNVTGAFAPPQIVHVTVRP